jgi:hypothetical protein
MTTFNQAWFVQKIRERAEEDRRAREDNRKKQDAFAATMQALFRQHPINGPLLAKQVGKERGKWLGITKKGFASDVEYHLDAMAAACVIPVGQVKAIHALIFG